MSVCVCVHVNAHVLLKIECMCANETVNILATRKRGSVCAVCTSVSSVKKN